MDKKSFITLGPVAIFATLFFFVTYESAQYARVLHYSSLEMLVRDKQSSLLDPLVSYKKWIVVNIHNGDFFFLA